MFGQYDNIKIKGIAAVVPENIKHNIDYINYIDEKSLRKQIRITGVEKRHIVSENQTSADLCTYAAEKLINKLKWEKDSINVMVYVTQTPDLERPSTAMKIQKRLGIGKNCFAFDVNLGCSGYIAGLTIVAGLLQNCGGRGLLLTGDGKFGFERKRIEDSLLMGDAGAATALEFEKNNKIFYSMQSDGNGYKALIKEFGKPSEMNGNVVFSFTINEVVNSIKEFKNRFLILDENIDFYVLHQAQKLIISTIANICEISDNKLLSSLKDYGNTSSASIPLTLCSNNNIIKNKEMLKVLMCGYGIGLSWGCIFAEIDPQYILQVESSNICYSD